MLRWWSPFKVTHLKNSSDGRILVLAKTCLVLWLKVSSAKGSSQELGWGQWRGWWGSMLKIMQLDWKTKRGRRWTGSLRITPHLVVRWDFRLDRGLDKTDRGNNKWTHTLLTVFVSLTLVKQGINTFFKSNIYLSVCSQSAAQAPSHCPPSWRRELNQDKTCLSLQFQRCVFV